MFTNCMADNNWRKQKEQYLEKEKNLPEEILQKWKIFSRIYSETLGNQLYGAKTSSRIEKIFNHKRLWFCSAVFKQNTTETWPKGCSLVFLKNGDLKISKKYRDLSLTGIAAKFYNALFLNCFRLEIEKYRKVFRSNRSKTSLILKIRQSIEVQSKNLVTTLLPVDFSEVFDPVLKGKLEQIGVKKIITFIMMLYKTLKQWFPHLLATLT